MTAKLRVEHSLQGVSLGLLANDTVPDARIGATDLDDAIRLYLGDTAELKSKKTYDAYAFTLSGFRAACPVPKRLEAVTRRDILVYMAALRQAGNVPRTIRNRVDYLKIFFTHCKVA